MGARRLRLRRLAVTASYESRRRRNFNPASAMRPVPRRVILAGSGTVVGAHKDPPLKLPDAVLPPAVDLPCASYSAALVLTFAEQKF